MFERFQDYFLSSYKDAPVTVAIKSRILLMLSMILVLIQTANIVLVDVVIRHSLSATLLSGIWVLMYLADFWLLRKKRFHLAVNLSIILLFAIMAGVCLTSTMVSPLFSAARAGLMFGVVVIYSCLVGDKLLQPILSTAGSMAAVVFFYLRTLRTIGPGPEGVKFEWGWVVNFCWVLLFTGIMAVLTIRIYKQAIRQAEQKAADAAVHSRIAASAENKVRTILDSINEAVFIHELDTGRIVDVNRKAAELYGYPRERLLAMDPVNLMSDAAPLDHPMVTRRTAALDLHTAYLFEQQSKRSDGSLFWAEVNISKAEIDGVVRIVASVRDITERKRIEDDRARLEEKLRQSEKMDAIGQLAGGVAHDFNNQLTGILGYAELTKMAAVSEDIRNYASFIIDSARKAADLTQELLSFSRKTNIQDIPVDIHECIEKTSSILKRSIDKRIAILSRLDAERFVVTGDPSRMQNALLNLALNARDAMPSGGTILFSTRNVPELPDSIPKPVFTPSAGYLLVEVADTGIGIPREIQKRVFEPFFTTKGVGKGTGLGLASVFSTVQGHQGHITFYSEPGKGTVFKIWLPAPVREADHITAQDASSAPQRKLRVLLVDDEPMVRRIGSELLRSLGHSVVPMANGPDAIASFRESPDEFDLVLLDMIMPDMNGRDVYAALRSIRHDIKVLLVSGFSMDSDTQMAIRAGADGFLQKPYNMNELKRAINSIG